MVRKGGQPKVHVRSTRGRGGQKSPKNSPHGLSMTPYALVVNDTIIYEWSTAGIFTKT